MKRIIVPFLSILIFSFGAQAQKATDKVVLTKGQKINMTTEMKSNMTQAKRGDMKSDMVIASTVEVVNITPIGYVLGATMNRAKMKFNGFGMEQEYDSEDENKKEGMMAQGFEKAIGKTETVEIDFSGKAIEKEGEMKKGKGMMRMLGGGDIASTIESAFLILPKDLEVGKKWRTTSEKDGLKVITEYTFQGMMGNMANITANQQTKGEVAGGRGGSFTTVVNQLTQMTIMVDVNTGLVSMKTIETKDDSSTEMGGETYKSTGVTNMTIIFD